MGRLCYRLKPTQSRKVLTIKFEKGWLWGTGGATQPLTIQLPDSEITISSGRFALEAPDVISRLVVYL